MIKFSILDDKLQGGIIGMDRKKKPDVHALILLLMIIGGALVRFWGIDFGLPHTECRPDELRIVHVAFSFFTGSLHPHFFDYPTFYMYLLFFVYVLYFLGGCALGRFDGLQDLINEFFIRPDAFYLMDRGLSALLGTATIPVVYVIARRIFGRRSALFAAGLMSVAYLHVRDSHFGVTDVSTTFFILVAVFFLLKSQSSKTGKTYLLTGIFTGLAVSTKYSGIFLVVPMVLSHVITLREEKTRSLLKLVDCRMCFFVLGMAGTFFITSPFVILDFNSFLPAFLKEMAHLKQGHWNIVLERGWWYHARYTLFYGVGPVVMFAALGGFAVGLYRNRRSVMITAAFPVVYYFIAGRGYTVFLRYMIPVVPFLCIFAAGFADQCGDLVHRCFARFSRVVVLSILFLLFAWQPTYNSLKFCSLLAKTDNRNMATDWINSNLESGHTVYQCFWPGLKLETPPDAVKLYPERETLEKFFKKRIARGREQLILKAKREYLHRQHYTGFLEWQYDPEQKMFTAGQKEQQGLPQYMITIKSPLKWLSFPPPAAVQKYLDTAYSLVKSFVAFDMSGPSTAWFDQMDAFYLPYAGFEKVIRPGPNIYIYKRDPAVQKNTEKNRVK